MILKLRERAETTAADIERLLLRAERVALSVLHGVHGRRKSGIGENFWQFREYSHDDEPRTIDWRQSAKGERVYVKQKEWETAQKVLLWVLNSAGMNFSSASSLPTKLDCAQVLAMAMAVLAVKSGENVASVYAERAGHSERALETFGLYLMEQSATALPDISLMRPAANAHLVFVSDFLNKIDDIQACFETLGASVQNGVVIQVLDPAEIELPYDGRVQFLQPGGHAKIRIEHVKSVRTAYQERLQTHMRMIEELCADLGWIYVLHRTDGDMTETLRHIAEKIEERSLGV